MLASERDLSMIIGERKGRKREKKGDRGRERGNRNYRVQEAGFRVQVLPRSTVIPA
jgi:hypothetical protein